jgi:hypothetical protein
LTFTLVLHRKGNHMETTEDKPGGEPVPPDEESIAPAPQPNPELEGYIAGLAHGLEVVPYKDDIRAREWERGYRRGWTEWRLASRAWWMLKFLGAPAALACLMLGFSMGRHQLNNIYDRREPYSIPSANRVTQFNLSGVEDRLDRLNDTIEKSCQSQPVTFAVPSEVRAAVTAEQTAVIAEQRPKLSLAIDGIITGAINTGTAVIKDADALKKQILKAAVDSTQKVVDGTSEALIKRFISKEREKTLPENIQITVSQNNGPAPTKRAPGPSPSQTTVCTAKKK